MWHCREDRGRHFALGQAATINKISGLVHVNRGEFKFSEGPMASPPLQLCFHEHTMKRG